MKVFMIVAFALNLCICFKRKAPITGEVVKDRKSMDESKALGQCSCDVTINSCDVYCCCDLDCDNDVRTFMKDSTNYKDYCAKNYLSQIYKPFEQCISKKLIYHKNERMGMKVEEIDDNYCVTLDIGGVFSQKTDALSAQRLKQLQPYELPYPNMMDIMTQPKILDTTFSQYTETSQLIKFAQYEGQAQRAETWFVPQPVGFNGICMNSVGVMFGQDIDNVDCNQYITNLEAASKTFLNSDTFLNLKLWNRYQDTNKDVKMAESSNAKELTVKNQWVFDQATNKLEKLAEGAAKPAVSYSKCKASNVVKSVFYTVEYELSQDTQSNSPSRGQIVKRIINVYADVVYQKELAIDEKFCDDKTKPLAGGKADQIVYNQALQDGSVAVEGAKFTQTFGVKFLSKEDAKKAANGQILFKSGNPGYTTNMNLIVGESAAPDGFKKDSDPQKVNKDGFYLFSHDNEGNCYANADNSIFDYPSKKLRFGEIAQLTCATQMTAAELEAFCKDADHVKFKSLEIFKQIDERFNWISKFGNPNIAFLKDWIQIDKPEKLTEKKWEDDTKPKLTCTGGIGYDIKILTSKLGFEDKLQTYVVGAEVQEIVEDWTYARADAAAQDFLHVLSISFHEVVSDQLYLASTSEPIFIVPKLPKDLFYPFELAS